MSAELETGKERAKAVADRALAELGARLEAGGSDALKAYLDVVERFRSYSWRNCMLIAMQREHATHVAGFHAWRALGRHVIKGEHGIQILAPMIRGAKDKATGEAREDGGRVFGFRVVYVFDVAQTEGEPLPEAPSIHAAGGDAAVYGRLVTWARARALELDEAAGPDTMLAGAHGETDGRRIRLAAHLGADTGARIGTLAHELAHCLLHFPAGPAALEGMGRPEAREGRELEAEAVAYVVARAAGCTRLDGMADYLVSWKGSPERLAGALTRVRAAALVLLPVLASAAPAGAQVAA